MPLPQCPRAVARRRGWSAGPGPVCLVHPALQVAMAAAATASATSDDDASTCFICLEPHSGPGSSQHLLHVGCCTCCGGSGFGHATCIAKAAQETNEWMWAECPTCKQMRSGQMALGLARARASPSAICPLRICLQVGHSAHIHSFVSCAAFAIHVACPKPEPPQQVQQPTWSRCCELPGPLCGSRHMKHVLASSSEVADAVAAAAIATCSAGWTRHTGPGPADQPRRRATARGHWGSGMQIYDRVASWRR